MFHWFGNMNLTSPSAFDRDGGCFSSNGQLAAVTTGQLIRSRATASPR